MPKLLLFAFVLFTAWGLPARAQEGGVAGVEAALAQGDADRLTALCAERVEVTMNGATTAYSQAQVRYVLGSFFEQNPPRAFHFEHHLTSDGNAAFASGLFETVGRDYQVMVRMGRRDGVWELRELRIEG